MDLYKFCVGMSSYLKRIDFYKIFCNHIRNSINITLLRIQKASSIYSIRTTFYSLSSKPRVQPSNICNQMFYFRYFKIDSSTTPLMCSIQLTNYKMSTWENKSFAYFTSRNYKRSYRKSISYVNCINISTDKKYSVYKGQTTNYQSTWRIYIEKNVTFDVFGAKKYEQTNQLIRPLILKKLGQQQNSFSIQVIIKFNPLVLIFSKKLIGNFRNTKCHKNIFSLEFTV